jgi:curved DNA-binding protein CbpA
MASEFHDYYELLELSPNANLATIERVFRYFATKWHPDVGGDKDKFTLLVSAFETLRDPASRAAYDAKYQQRQQQSANLVEHARAAGRDTVDRHKLLALFYARRRQDIRRPALGIHTVEHLMKCPAEVLEFHLWYFREKGWLIREDSGGLSITAEGVDRIESGEVKQANNLLIEWQRKATNTTAPKQDLATNVANIA